MTTNFNWGRASFDEPQDVKSRFQAPFTKQISLNIQVRDETRHCGPHCFGGLAAAFAQAIAVWRSGCDRCDHNALSVIHVDQSTWLDRRAVDRVHQLGSGQVNLNLDAFQPGEADQLIASPAASVPTMQIVDYVDVTNDALLKNVLCPLGSDSVPWIGPAQAYLCGTHAAAAGESIHPLLILKNDATSCGPAKFFLACGLPTNAIEVSLGGWAYNIPTPSGNVLLITAKADAALNIRTILLHEVGHWFGVPHMTSDIGPLDIMADTYGNGKSCVSSISLTMMNNASDLRWKYRVSAGAGLKPPQGVQQ